MKLLIIGENCLLNLDSFHRSIFSSFSFISSIYARQIAAVTPKKHNVKIADENEDINFDEKFDAIHIHFKTGTALRAYKIADEFRKRGQIVILSGCHPSALPDEAKCHSDSVLIGSAELIWPIVLKDLENNKLKSLYKSDDDIEMKEYTSSKFFLPPYFTMVGVVEATRGCPYKCDFCQESNILYGSVFNKRPIDEVIKEVKLIPQKIILFCDASLTIDVNYTKALFEKMNGLNKKFICEGNVDVLAKDQELLKLSYEAGCIEWTVGFESFAQHALKDVHKKTNKVEDFYLVVNNIHKHKMSVLGTFMFGFEYDKSDVFEFTLENIEKLGLDSARFAILTPYPGTPLYKKLDEEGRIITKDWSKYNRRTVVFKPKNMSIDNLQKGFNIISNNFYTIPKIISRDIRSIMLGVYPFFFTISRNIDGYMDRPGR